MNQDFQSLITRCLTQAHSAALLLRRSGRVIASSPGFQICSEEAEMFTDTFKHLTTTRRQGFSFREEKFRCVRADRNSIYCKNEGRGLILVRTSLFVIVARYSEGMSPAVCVEAVEKLAEYLREKGK